jgi:hypothetical protein
MQASAPVKAFTDTWTGILTVTRSPHRLSFPCQLISMMHTPSFDDANQQVSCREPTDIIAWHSLGSMGLLK